MCGGVVWLFGWGERVTQYKVVPGHAHTHPHTKKQWSHKHNKQGTLTNISTCIRTIPHSTHHTPPAAITRFSDVRRETYVKIRSTTHHAPILDAKKKKASEAIKNEKGTQCVQHQTRCSHSRPQLLILLVNRLCYCLVWLHCIYFFFLHREDTQTQKDARIVYL